MKRKLFTLLTTVVALLTLFVTDAEARRLGGARSFGMSRSTTPTQPATPPKTATAPQQQAAPTAPPPVQAGKRNWLGPIAGLAAGIGLAALLSHFGMGEGVANFLMLALLVMAAVFVFRLLFRKNQPQGRLQYAGGGMERVEPRHFDAEKVGAGGAAPLASAASIPVDFDTEGFLRQAKLNFVRLQAANDRGDMDDLKTFTTPEVFAEVQMQYEERGRTPQQTDVVQLDAALLEVVTEANLHIASVRFSGLLRETADSAPAPFDEVWHLAKPIDGSFGWRVAGIQQIA